MPRTFCATSLHVCSQWDTNGYVSQMIIWNQEYSQTVIQKGTFLTMLECFRTDMWLRYNVCFITVTEEVVILNSYYSHIYKYICICIFTFGQISIPECANFFQTYCGVIHAIPYCILKMLPNIWVSQLPRGVHFSFFKPEKHMFS